MGLISKFISNLSIMICLAVFVNSAGKSKLKLKLNALDNLFRSEMYLVNEKLDISRKEREKLLEKFEETMGYLGDRGKTKSKKLPDSTLDEEQGKRIAILSNDIKKLRDNAERSTKDTGELSDSLIRLRWGVLEEKVARKSVTDTVIQQFEEVQKNQNVTIKNREEFVTNINRLISNQNDYQDEMKKSLNEIVNIINSVLSNQTDIFNKLDEIFTIQGDLINKVNGMASQDSVGKLEVNLGKSY